MRASLLLAALALGCAAACWRPSGDGRLDVVLVVVDTLRARNLSLYGYDRRTSPNLERFARDAVTYATAITPGTWTVPAHAALFTGLTPSFHGAERVPGDRILATPINPQMKTLAEILRDRGFRTGAFVGNTTYLTPALGFARGFESFGNALADNRATGIVSAALAWLRESTTPAFLFLNILDPHEPYEPPPPYDARFPGRKPEYGAYLTEKVREGAAVTPELRAHFLALYDGEVAFTDDALGKLFAGLRDQGRYDRSLIILTSDHGELFGEHGLAGHGNATYEPLLHVPLIVKYPWNRDGGTRVGTRVSTLGVFATILEAASIPESAGTMSTPLHRPHPVWVEEIDFGGARVVVGYDGPWKVVRTVQDDETRVHVYDLSTDPEESRPVAGDGVASSLLRRIEEFVAATRPRNDAPAPVIDPERERQLRALGYVQSRNDETRFRLGSPSSRC